MNDGERHGSRSWWGVPRPPWWLCALAVCTVLGTGGWQLISTSGRRDAGVFAGAAVWPGLAIGGVVFVVAWLGWSLDLE